MPSTIGGNHRPRWAEIRSSSTRPLPLRRSRCRIRGSTGGTSPPCRYRDSARLPELPRSRDSERAALRGSAWRARCEDAGARRSTDRSCPPAGALRRRRHHRLWSVDGPACSGRTHRRPVVMSDNGRRAIDDRHPLAMNGLPGAPFSSMRIVVVIGSRFIDALTPTRRGRRTRRDSFTSTSIPWIWAHAPARSGHRADARVALEHMCMRVKARVALSNENALASRRGRRRRSTGSSRRPLHSRDACRVRRTASSSTNCSDRLPCADRVSNLRAAHLYRPRLPGYVGLRIPHGARGCGGLPGTSRTVDHRDGGFGWNLQELATARKYRYL